MKHIVTLALLASAGVAAPATAQVAFRQLGVYAETRGGFDDDRSSFPERTIANSLPVAPIATTSSFADTQGRASFTADAAAGASLVDASRGTLSFSAATTASSLAGSPEAVGVAFSNAIYAFSVASLSRLSFDYTLAITGNTPAAYILLTERSPSDNPIRALLNQSAIRTPGALSFDLTPGIYQLRFSNNVNQAISTATTGFDEDSISGTMSFEIAAVAVPEPGSWMLMLAGFGLAGSALRGSRRRVAFG